MEAGLPFLLTIEFDGGSELLPAAARVELVARKYGFRPTWLMGAGAYQHPVVLEQAARWQQDGAEIGVLLDAGRVLPLVDLGREGDRPLTEYPDSVIDEKLSGVTSILTQALPRRPVSIRSIPAAVDDRYYAALVKHGYKVDLTVIPHVRIGAQDFTAYSEKAYMTPQGVFEIPRTVRRRERGLWRTLLGVPPIRSLRLSSGNFSVVRRVAAEGLRGAPDHLDLRIAAEDWHRGEPLVRELERLLPVVQTGAAPVTAEEFLIRYKNEQLRKGPL